MRTFVQHTVKCDCQSSPWHGPADRAESPHLSEKLSLSFQFLEIVKPVVKLGIYEENSLLNLLLFKG